MVDRTCQEHTVEPAQHRGGQGTCGRCLNHSGGSRAHLAGLCTTNAKLPIWAGLAHLETLQPLPAADALRLRKGTALLPSPQAAARRP